MGLSKTPSEELFQSYLAGDMKAREILRADMEELVRLVARRFSEDASEGELLPVGMAYFDTALKKYVEHRRLGRTGEPPYKFSTYFIWWIRESIRTYLGTSKTPLKRIHPRAR